MGTQRTLVTATTGMALVTAVSRVSGWLRDKVVASYLGAQGIGDAFVAGFRAPNLFRQLLAEGALHATFIPTLAEVDKGGQREEVRRFVAAMTSTLLLLAGLVVALGMWQAEPFANLLVPAYRVIPEKHALTVYFTRWFFPYLGFISLAALVQGVLNVRGKFLLSAATPIFLNASIALSVLLAAWQGWPLAPWLVFGVLLGGFLQFATQWVAAAQVGLPAVPGGGAFLHHQVRTVLRKALPLLLSSGIYPITVFLATYFASSAGDGALFCVYAASRTNELVYGVIVVQLFTALLPTLARDENADETFTFALRLQSLVVFPAMVFLMVLAPAVSGLLFGGGRFGHWAVTTTAQALVAFAAGMPALAWVKLASGRFYAVHDTRSPVKASVLSLLVFAAAGFLFTPRWGAPGVAAATSLSQYVAGCYLWWRLRTSGRAPKRELFSSLWRHGLSAGLMAAALKVLANRTAFPLVTSLRSAAMVAGFGLLGLAVYAVGLWLTRAPELAEIKRLLQRRQA